MRGDDSEQEGKVALVPYENGSGLLSRDHTDQPGCGAKGQKVAGCSLRRLTCSEFRLIARILVLVKPRPSFDASRVSHFRCRQCVTESNSHIIGPDRPLSTKSRAENLEIVKQR